MFVSLLILLFTYTKPCVYIIVLYDMGTGLVKFNQNIGIRNPLSLLFHLKNKKFGSITFKYADSDFWNIENRTES